MRTNLLIAALTAMQVAAPALAQNPSTEGDPTFMCFARAYTADHMAEHPGQRVAEIQVMLEHAPYDDRSYYNATIRAMLVDRYGAFFANSGSCQETEEGILDCGIECDGGQFEIRMSDDGTATLLNRQYGFVLFGGCGEEDVQDAIRIEADSEHNAFLLYPVPVDACPIDMWQLYPPEAR